jgi:hypothetical protein
MDEEGGAVVIVCKREAERGREIYGRERID